MAWEVSRPGEDRLDAVLRWDTAELLELFPFTHHAEVTAVVDARGCT